MLRRRACDAKLTGERIVEERNVCIVVQCPRDVDSLLLSARQVDSLFANLSLVSVWKHVEICLETGIVHCLVVPLLIVWLAKENVVPAVQHNNV